MDDLNETLEDLFTEAAEAHHAAYIDTDGVDAEWPLWYADYLQDKLGDLLDADFTKSELIYLLVLADKDLNMEAPGANWQRYYADFFLNRYA